MCWNVPFTISLRARFFSPLFKNVVLCNLRHFSDREVDINLLLPKVIALRYSRELALEDFTISYMIRMQDIVYE